MKTPILSDEHWHSMRKQNVGGSDIATLFDVSPYKTKFTLWHEKAGNVTEDNEGNSRTDWGKRLEAGIAEGVAADMRWMLRMSRPTCAGCCARATTITPTTASRAWAAPTTTT